MHEKKVVIFFCKHKIIKGVVDYDLTFFFTLVSVYKHKQHLQCYKAQSSKQREIIILHKSLLNG